MTEDEDWYRCNRHRSQESPVRLILEHLEEKIRESEIRYELDTLGREMKLEPEPAKYDRCNDHGISVAEHSRDRICEERDDHREHGMVLQHQLKRAYSCH